jgi:hypothetical protein
VENKQEIMQPVLNNYLHLHVAQTYKINSRAGFLGWDSIVGIAPYYVLDGQWI